jgi:hypothetical protein
MIGRFSSPVTDAERRSWQGRALRVLDRLLGLDLPPLTWTVGPTATLVGRVLLGDVDTRRARWQAWVTALAAIPAPEHPDAGVTHLRTSIHDRHDNLVEIVLLTTLYHSDADLDGR